MIHSWCPQDLDFIDMICYMALASLLLLLLVLLLLLLLLPLLYDNHLSFVAQENGFVQVICDARRSG